MVVACISLCYGFSGEMCTSSFLAGSYVWEFFKFISDDDLCVMNHRPLAGVHMYVDSVHEAN